MNYDELLRQNQQLINENIHLRKLLGIPEKSDLSHSNLVDKYSSISEKVSIFRTLFQGRNDIYAVYWQSKSGKKGYSPKCKNEWDRKLCQKPKVPCKECHSRLLEPLTDQVIINHLSGKIIVGVYPLLLDESCCFLALDFDDKSWMSDIRYFFNTCSSKNIPVYLEKSRSGNGAHAWIFFECQISARKARLFGSALLSETMEKTGGLTFSSFDRFFPNQDRLPKGGFGNLIALPLQKKVRTMGNTEFMNTDFKSYPDQWTYLSAIQKLSESTIDIIIKNIIQQEQFLGCPSWKDNKKQIQLKPKLSTNISEKKGIQIIVSNKIYIIKRNLSPQLLVKLRRLAVFSNPQFYRNQSLRLSNYNTPRFISCFMDLPNSIALPIGCMADALELLSNNGYEFQMTNRRDSGIEINLSFNGKLHPEQITAHNHIIEYNIGILVAPPGFGKTVVAAHLIAKRNVNTLVIVNRSELMQQWKERMCIFLNLKSKNIGCFGSGRKRLTGKLDIAMMQSLYRDGKVKPFLSDYGQIIVDECHHIPAFSFEQVLSSCKSKYILGLTATPERKDGHQPILFMQCGPIRYEGKINNTHLCNLIVKKRETEFSPINPDSTIQEIYSELIRDDDRNNMIFNDIMNALEAGRSPIVLTERKEHLEYLKNRLAGFARNIFVFQGGMGKRKRAELMIEKQRVPKTEERIILATGRYIGEGFDDPRLDTLFLLLPISWKGTLQQYTGRLHRNLEQKDSLIVYDYVDQHPMLQKMFKRRSKSYKALGYRITDS